MRWLPNISSASAPPSSASSPKTSKLSPSPSDDFSTSFKSKNPPHNDANTTSTNVRARSGFRAGSVGSGGGPQLTRQRKLRHLTDHDVAGTSTSSSSENLNSAALPRSQSASTTPSTFSSCAAAGPCSASRLSPSVPVPLPLPLPLSENSSSGDGDLQRLPSPKDRGGDVAGDGRDGAPSSASPSISAPVVR